MSMIPNSRLKMAQMYYSYREHSATLVALRIKALPQFYSVPKEIEVVPYVNHIEGFKLLLCRYLISIDGLYLYISNLKSADRSADKKLLPTSPETVA